MCAVGHRGARKRESEKSPPGAGQAVIPSPPVVSGFGAYICVPKLFPHVFKAAGLGAAGLTTWDQLFPPPPTSWPKTELWN